MRKNSKDVTLADYLIDHDIYVECDKCFGSYRVDGRTLVVKFGPETWGPENTVLSDCPKCGARTSRITCAFTKTPRHSDHYAWVIETPWEMRYVRVR